MKLNINLIILKYKIPSENKIITVQWFVISNVLLKRASDLSNDTKTVQNFMYIYILPNLKTFLAFVM